MTEESSFLTTSQISTQSEPKRRRSRGASLRLDESFLSSLKASQVVDLFAATDGCEKERDKEKEKEKSSQIRFEPTTPVNSNAPPALVLPPQSPRTPKGSSITTTKGGPHSPIPQDNSTISFSVDHHVEDQPKSTIGVGGGGAGWMGVLEEGKKGTDKTEKKTIGRSRSPSLFRRKEKEKQKEEISLNTGEKGAGAGTGTGTGAGAGAGAGGNGTGGGGGGGGGTGLFSGGTLMVGGSSTKSKRRRSVLLSIFSSDQDKPTSQENSTHTAEKFSALLSPPIRKRDDTLDILKDKKYEPLSALLRKNNHVLCRVFIAHAAMIADSASLRGLPDTVKEHEGIINFILTLHNDPPSLFFDCFQRECASVKNLAAVMRERTIAVRILQYIWSVFDGRPVIRPFLNFAAKISPHKLKFLTESQPQGAPKARIEKLKKTVLSMITTLLSSDSVPLLICILCYRCVAEVKKRDDIQIDEDTRVANWAVGAIFFLRFLVPALTSHASNQIPETERKAVVLFGRFLMKMTCGSTFNEAPDSILNEVLESSFPLMTLFCEEVVSLGKRHCTMSYSDFDDVRQAFEFDASANESKLYDFLAEHSRNLSLELDEIASKETLSRDSDTSTTPPPQSPRDIVRRFKNELSLIVGPSSVIGFPGETRTPSPLFCPPGASPVSPRRVSPNFTLPSSCRDKLLTLPTESPRSPHAHNRSPRTIAASLTGNLSKMSPSPVISLLTSSLQENHHALARAFLIYFTHSHPSGISHLVSLHQKPERLFMACFESELRKSKSLPELLQWRAGSMWVLRQIWEGLKVSNIVDDFLVSLEKDVLEVNEANNGIQKILDPDSYPQFMFLLCYHCAHLIWISPLASPPAPTPLPTVVGAENAEENAVVDEKEESVEKIDGKEAKNEGTLPAASLKPEEGEEWENIVKEVVSWLVFLGYILPIVRCADRSSPYNFSTSSEMPTTSSEPPPAPRGGFSEMIPSEKLADDTNEVALRFLTRMTHQQFFFLGSVDVLEHLGASCTANYSKFCLEVIQRGKALASQQDDLEMEEDIWQDAGLLGGCLSLQDVLTKLDRPQKQNVADHLAALLHQDQSTAPNISSFSTPRLELKPVIPEEVVHNFCLRLSSIFDVKN